MCPGRGVKAEPAWGVVLPLYRLLRTTRAGLGLARTDASLFPYSLPLSLPLSPGIVTPRSREERVSRSRGCGRSRPGAMQRRLCPALTGSCLSQSPAHYTGSPERSCQLRPNSGERQAEHSWTSHTAAAARSSKPKPVRAPGALCCILRPAPAPRRQFPPCSSSRAPHLPKKGRWCRERAAAPQTPVSCPKTCSGRGETPSPRTWRAHSSAGSGLGMMLRGVRRDISTRSRYQRPSALSAPAALSAPVRAAHWLPAPRPPLPLAGAALSPAPPRGGVCPRVRSGHGSERAARGEFGFWGQKRREKERKGEITEELG